MLFGQKLERVLEDVVRHLPAKDSTSRLVESPVDAEVDTALAVFFFGLGQSRKAARDQWTHIAISAARDSIEFVGHERKRYIVGAVEQSQRLEQRRSHPGMTGRIGRKWRSKVDTIRDVAGRRSQRHPCRIA